MLKKGKIAVTVVLDGVRSLHNVGSFFRTCDAFAVSGLVLCGITGTPPNREIHKTALGAESTVPWEYRPSTVEAIGDLRRQGWRPVAVEQAPGAVMLHDFEPVAGAGYALVFGNEVDGVSPEALEKCDFAIEIPQFGAKKSLNVSVAGGVVLWHVAHKFKKCGGAAV